MTEINNNNRLIANSPFFTGVKKDWFDILRQKGQEERFYNEASFHKSWNWLMPVVEKIEKTGKALVITIDWDNEYNRHDALIEVPGSTILVSKKTRIEAIYHAVVQFIEWYNQQTEGVVTTSKQP